MTGSSNRRFGGASMQPQNESRFHLVLSMLVEPPCSL